MFDFLFCFVGGGGGELQKGICGNINHNNFGGVNEVGLVGGGHLKTSLSSLSHLSFLFFFLSTLHVVGGWVGVFWHSSEDRNTIYVVRCRERDKEKGRLKKESF